MYIENCAKQSGSPRLFRGISSVLMGAENSLELKRLGTAQNKK